MKSKTSFFDRAIFTRSLRTAAIPAALYTLLLLVLLPMALPNELMHIGGDLTPMLTLKRAIFLLAPVGLLTFFYGLILAWLLFFLLFKTSSAYRYAAMPVRREALFGTNCLVGVLAFLVPHAIVALAMFLVTAALGYPLPLACLEWFCAASCECLFFFSFAVLLVMIVGQMAAMPVIYVILNCAISVLYTIFKAFLQAMVYGMPLSSSSGESCVQYFSPIVAIAAGMGPQSDSVYNEAFNVVDITLANGWYAYALGIVGLAFLVLALFLFKKREMERCGDVVAVKSLKPLFLYAFTFGCSFVIAAGILRLLNMGDTQINVWLILLLLFLGAFLGYFGAQMMLKKTVRVFTKGWLGFGVSCAVLALAIGFFAFDLSGYEARVPNKEDVETVSLSLGRYAHGLYPVDDEAAIEDVISLHKNILSQKDEQQALAKRGNDANYTGYSTVRSYYATFTYTLKDGRELSRSYVLSAEPGCKDPNNPLVQFAQDYNSLTFALARWAPPFEVTEGRVATCEIRGFDEDGKDKALNLSSEDAYAFYTGCVLPDFADSSLGRMDFALDEVPELEAAKTEEVEIGPADTSRWISCELYFTFRDEPGKPSSSYWCASNLSVTEDAARTIRYLDDLGFDTDFGYSEN